MCAQGSNNNKNNNGRPPEGAPPKGSRRRESNNDARYQQRIPTSFMLWGKSRGSNGQGSNKQEYCCVAKICVGTKISNTNHMQHSNLHPFILVFPSVPNGSNNRRLHEGVLGEEIGQDDRSLAHFSLRIPTTGMLRA